MSENLDDLRKEINKLDINILDLIKKRMEVSIKIGNYKKKNKIDILNSGREKEVISNLIKYNNINNINLEEEFINDLWNLLMKYSKKIQE
tara:strand:+ start:148 stop:417 length:270 start_codon:yes stop_codon:yes gene_type:complete